ncbi:MAG TPA: AAA family ATPase [Gemmataceae bacterium]|nr:AAA family ATPase [Gemmataceae bacterium]
MASEIAFPVGLLHQRLDSGHVLTECLFHPDLSRLAADRERGVAAVAKNLEDSLPRLNPAELYRRRLGTAGAGAWVALTLDPPRPSLAWREPVRLRFPVVTWQHGEEAALARVPGLGIEVIAPTADDLPKLIESEIVAALRRSGDSATLARLAWRQRAWKFKVEWRSLSVSLPTLKQRAQREEGEAGEEKKPVLEQVATLMNGARLPRAYEAEAAVAAVADALTAPRPQSVLLIGPGGVGKTAAFRELVVRRANFQLGSTPFYQTSGARIVAGQCGFGMWQERCTDLVREAAKKRAVLHLGNLVELMEVGKSEHNQTGIAGFLRPAIARGELLCVAECTPEQLPMIEREDPQLVDAFRQVQVEEPDAARGRAILDRFASDWRRDGRQLTPAALDAIDRLHRRYATYSAFPGRPIRFLTDLRKDGDRGTTVHEADVLAAFTRETGLPRVLLDPAVPLDVDETRAWFGRRVMGQPEAVDLVTDLLATVKAGLTRPNRPIASLLFVGPTGVGKTEMAKALAEFLFGSKDRLTRFDMSEYADPVAVRRLAGSAFGGEGLLTAKVREQPFCVLLLDEFEKAHPSFFDLLLQALGEARLTDAGGRLADFRNAVIVLTSNLGAESFRAGSPGFGSAAADAGGSKQHFLREVEKFLRPELFNRLDRLVPFAPLDAATIEHVARREWDQVLARDGVRFRGVKVTAADGVVPRLAARGFDPRYGARPLKRAIERDVLAPVAHQMNRYSADLALDVTVGLAGDGLTAAVKPRQEAGKAVAAVQRAGEAGRAAQAAVRLRRLHQLLEKSSTVRDLENDVYQLTEVEKAVTVKQLRKKGVTTGEQLKLARLGRLREVQAEVHRQRREATELEDATLVAFHSQAPPDPAVAARLTKATADWDGLLVRLYRASNPGTAALTLALFSESRDWLFVLAAAYVEVARGRGLGVTAVQYVVARPAEAPDDLKPPKPPGEPEEVARAWDKDFLIEVRKGRPLRLTLQRDLLPVPFVPDDLNARAIGVGLEIAGDETTPRFATEAGLHVFRLLAPPEGVSPDVLVETESGPLDEYLPPEGIERRGGIGARPPRRIYAEDRGRIVDPVHDSSAPWDRGLVEPTAAFTALNLRAELMRLVLE